MKCCRDEHVEAPRPGCPCFHCYVAGDTPNNMDAPPDINDMVNHPKHYTSHPSGVECVDIIEHFPHNVGAAIKYLWRHGLKSDTFQDLEKARWYVDREIQRVKKFNLLNRRPNGESTR